MIKHSIITTSGLGGALVFDLKLLQNICQNQKVVIWIEQRKVTLYWLCKLWKLSKLSIKTRGVYELNISKEYGGTGLRWVSA